ncbi:MAG: dTMP kinase [Nitrospinota bacterium]
MAGRLITFEGVEGSGKTTQINLLGERLRSEGYSVCLTREPGGTALGDRVRRLLLDVRNTDIDPLTELLLYQACRSQHVREVVLPHLSAGEIVLCDRFTDSTLAYQGFGRGLERERIALLNELASGGCRPSLTVLLDVEPTLGLERVGRLGSRDRLESEALEFHWRVFRGFRELAAEEPERIKVVDGSASVEEVQRRVWEIVRKAL